MDYKNGLWVFGYGSLIWKPGFDYAKKQRARLAGFQRGFCMWSVHYRGTETTPGLVLGLDEAAGRHCDGVAYFVSAKNAAQAHAYLRERELVSYAYLEQFHLLELADGSTAEALCYIVDPHHSQYASGLSLAAQAAVISKAAGSAGPNRDYLLNTASHLIELGIEDDDLQHLCVLLESTV